MQAVKVSYTVQPSFVAQNQANIAVALEELRQQNNPDIRYHVFLDPDGQTFHHLAIYRGPEVAKALLEMPSFLEFQRQRDESGLVAPPQITPLSWVNGSFDPFPAR
ncbi:ankyrin repeat domain-containing protein [Chitinophaga pendula]|uniref:ankyrin repeat domain-containing protein n=1 Tax=Chitinophaga TaxID=79328 RepID=UPI000BB008CC|nr:MULTISPECIES: ankyrin repeat domain-containing protein [Chitinophaga]ASZ15117.1 hypothetical protein CK934_25795 [Chitinophaga sp. MD30]UCJ08247.1 ankyrin repeat domain-containing protein [Chitinophaga pendula]